MSMDAIKLCVQIVDYPQEEINILKKELNTCKIQLAGENLEVISDILNQQKDMVDKYYKLQNQYNVLEDNFVLMTDNRNQYCELYGEVQNSLTKERLLTNETLMTAEAWKRKAEAWEDAYRSCKEDLQTQYSKETSLCNEWDNVRDKLKKELSSTTLLYEAYQDNYELLSEKHNKLLESHAKVLGELEQNKVTTQELIGEFNKVITQLYTGNLTALVLPKL